MKLGVNRWTMPSDWSLEECFAAAREAGFDCIEINIAESGYLTPDTSEEEAARIVRMAASAGIEISSVSTGMGWSHPLTDPDSARRQQATAIIGDQLRIARWLGCDTLLCVPGLVTAEIAYDQAYVRAQERLRSLEPVAAEYRVVIGVENVWNKFLLSPMEMARFIDELASPWIKAYFDVGNVLAYGYPQHWIRILGSRIKKVHVKDFRCQIGNIQGFANLLQGDVPWRDVREALTEIGYDDVVTAEVDGYPGHPRLGLKHIADALREVFVSQTG